MAEIVLTEGDDDYQVIGTTSDVIRGLDGNDQIIISYSDFPVPSATGLNMVIYGGAGDDTLGVAVPESDGTIYGEDGNDTIFFLYGFFSGDGYGGAGDDDIRVRGNGFGGAGNDIVSADIEAQGGDGSDIVSGGRYAYGDDGDDVVQGEEASGGAGSDEVRSNTAMYGGDGNDVLIGFGRGDASGGRGHDVFVSSVPPGSEDIWASDFEQGIDRMATVIPLTVVDHYTGTRNEVLSSGDDRGGVDLDGDGVTDTWLAIGVQTIKQSDLLFASHLTGDADDRSLGDASDELMLGRGGDDTLGGRGGDDWLFGGFGDDLIYGDAGDDLLVGNAGEDVLKGGAGADEIEGGDDNDTLLGGDGADRLIGSSGKDLLTGGAGADTFAFRAGDSGLGSANRDVIKDFENGLDHIDIGDAAYTIQQMGSNALLRLDADHDGAFEMQVNVAFAAGSSYAGFGADDLMTL